MRSEVCLPKEIRDYRSPLNLREAEFFLIYMKFKPLWTLTLREYMIYVLFDILYIFSFIICVPLEEIMSSFFPATDFII